jgi:hypothetical protein
MKSPVLMTLVLALAFSACQDSEKQQQKKEEAKVYIPVSEFVRSEIKAVDSASAGILRRININGKLADSSFIKAEEFDRLAQSFLPPELDSDRFENSFKESSFMDQTTETLTFTYESIDSTSTVRRVDVLLSPGMELDKLKSLYIERAYSAGDALVEQKMFWKSGQSFQIITLKSTQGGTPEEHKLTVIWDPFSYNKE